MDAGAPLSIRGPLLGQARVCEPILRALPEWFGIEAATQHYIREIESLPTFLALAGEHAVGFLTLKQHTPHAAEIYVMGLYPDQHRRGIGRALMTRAIESLRETGAAFLQVKMLGPSRVDDHYAQTRAFYEVLGFRALEETTQIWGEDNPCLVMVLYIGAG